MILNLQNIYKDYQQDKLVVPVLKDVCLTVEEGEYVAIMGPSGSGKTTLMNIIGCLDKPTSGTYELAGEDVLKLKDKQLSDLRLRSIGFVFQSFHLMPRETAVENVSLPLSYAGVKKKERRERAIKALERVGLGDRVDFRPTQLSGGQKRRVAIAGVLAMEPDILVLDEPTAGLDPKGRDEILGQISHLQKETGISVVLVSHSMEDVANYVERIIVMNKGKVMFDDVPHRVFSHVKELEAVGLAAPQVTYILHQLKDNGFDVDPSATTIEEAKETILQAVRKNSK